MATSPSDQNNHNVVAWLERLQASVDNQPSNKSVGGKVPSADTFRFKPREPKGLDDDDDEEDDGGGEGGGEDDEDDEDDRVPDTVPDETVPYGLIANLALEASTHSRHAARARSRPTSHLAPSPADPSANPNQVKEEEEDNDDVGVANEQYFVPGPASDLAKRASLIERHNAPEIIAHGLVTPEDVEQLFAIYFDKINVSF